MRGHLRVLLGFVAVATTTVVFGSTGASAVVPAGDRVCPEVAAGAPGDVAVVNLTPVGAVGPGNGQLVSSDVASPPLASNVNFDRNTVDPNVAVAPIGADGRVCFVNSPNADVDIIVDQLLALRSASFRPTPTGVPVRIADTRVALSGPTLQPDERRCMATGAPQGDLVLVNLLPLNATAPGNGVLVPGGTVGRPTASNVNFAPGTIDPNLAVGVAGPGGEVCLANSEHASVDLVADMLGSIRPGAFAPTSTGAPVRLFDTRVGLGGSRIATSEIRCVTTDLPPGDIAIVNLLPLNAAAPGFGSLGAVGVSNVNTGPGSVDPNLAFSTVDSINRLCYVNSDHGPVDLVADLLATIPASGSIAPTGGALLPERLIDSRPATLARQTCASATRCYRIEDGTQAISVSNDGGGSWTAIPTPVSGVIVSLRCKNVDRCLADWAMTTPPFAVSTLVTLDGGRSWSETPIGGVADLECPTSSVCVVVGRSAAVSRDRGASWQPVLLGGVAPGPRHVRALTCAAASCLAQYTLDGSPIPNNIRLSTTDGWATVAVTGT